MERAAATHRGEVRVSSERGATRVQCSSLSLHLQLICLPSAVTRSRGVVRHGGCQGSRVTAPSPEAADDLGGARRSPHAAPMIVARVRGGAECGRVGAPTSVPLVQGRNHSRPSGGNLWLYLIVMPERVDGGLILVGQLIVVVDVILGSF
ncbi:hypothetical protein E2C01_024186 [Portunus trituberculatus]|uniref:Uncharacterized protein n=1 Tax=Portunus trituberculatus TaxID=210409 RepID=A0A5B7EC21_PORTR|nr:hypothetical protein [Portunus trituberculatus]